MNTPPAPAPAPSTLATAWEQLRARPVSYSAVDSWRRDRYDWFCKYLCGVKMLPTLYMKAGTWFDRLVKHELIRRDGNMPYGDLSVSDEIDDSIKAMAQGAFNGYAGYLSRFKWLRVEYTCTKVLNGVTILGKPDAEIESDGRRGTFDWKLSTKLQTPGRTGLGKWNDQMWIYCWLQDHEWACIHNVDYSGACREFRACPEGSKIKSDLEDYVSCLVSRKCFTDDVDDWGRQSLLYEGMKVERAR